MRIESPNFVVGKYSKVEEFSLKFVPYRDESHSVLTLVRPNRLKKRLRDLYLGEGLTKSNNRLKSRNTNILTPGTKQRPTVNPKESGGSPVDVRNGTLMKVYSLGETRSLDFGLLKLEIWVQIS